MTAPDAPTAVLLDIDGTLVDSNFLHVHAWVRAFDEAGHPVDAWRVHRRIGMGSGRLLAELLGDDADRLGDEVKEAHTARYGELAGLLRPFDGARDLVRALADRGARVVLSTSAAPEEVETLRAVLDVDDLVQITGAADVDEAKPEPDLVHAALELAGVPADRAVFVGDSVWDVEAAARAGVTCVGVLSGGTSEAELRDAGAAVVVEDAAALLRDLDDIPVGALLRG
ncbi:HAD family hydrolase [Cellulomonas pakistanensis]|uniref:Haloacid dehalogenase n=1 Tax=Cellulomonas pakistanensis TaxID=992287 RepID=A0A919PD21_9CELL|nr:HAD family hydrolase [Cellulomonas pakistanensis]GIG37340.1 haloacid dehalogenase [Cellulomonas pakistanensis]